jgi:hypothetical protein
METKQISQRKKLSSVNEMAEGGIEVFAREDRILVVIHSGRYQITIEVD